MEDLTGKQLGPYRIVAPLGEGGMAAVYKAYQPGMERHVALKVLPQRLASDPQFVGRFAQEAKVIAKLQHPHILPVHDFGEAEGYTYIVMPLVESGTLATRLRGQPLPLEQIHRILSQVGDALDYAHSRGLVHRDVKPSNVLMDARGNCLLTDFGIAKLVEGTLKFTATGGVIGTPAYMSPEQGMGQTLDRRSDIYSLGIMLYEMATGRVPFDAETPVALMIKHINEPLPPPRALNPAVPEALEQVITTSLAKRPEGRYATAADMLQALQETIPETKRAAAAPLRPTSTARGDAGRAVTLPRPVEEAETAASALPQPARRRRIPLWGWISILGGLVAVGVFIVIAGLIRGSVLPAVLTLAPATPIAPTPISGATLPGPTSPAGTAVAGLKVVFSRGQVGCSDLIVLDLNANSEVTFRWAGNNEEPAWSPDGTQFVASSGGCPGNNSLVIFTPGTNQAAPLVSDGNNNIDPDWGADGRIYFVRGVRTDNGDVYSVAPDGSDLRRLGIAGRQPALSPDGRHLAFMRLDSDVWRIWVAPVDSNGSLGDALQLAFPSAPGGVHARMPNWTSDGTHVVFNITDRNTNSVALGSVELSNNSPRFSSITSDSASPFARPSCGRDHLCVANEVDGGLWLLRESNGGYTIERQITTHPDDWAPDIYP